ncbi:hypothetical protein MSIMFB_04439 [Mycobacterium simulans]|uniref:HNH nuclease domain-containing protein n=1 Tax=Mycobacterium simulans TaxID=627089 RepID=A0A7Z7NCC3_9MYCO|nr:HNH endonuclease [Mycobacterium simulans]SOJ56961.1 hypothetical protein MSIMFB_04439 [Mycobacterium simulans]
MTISAQTRKLLWGRAHNTCSFATCWQALTADEVDARTGEEFAVVVGQEAHIRSGSPGGPRYDPDYPSADIDNYQNLMLLCPTHHSLIDAHGGDAYDVDTLAKMKRRHEEQQGRKDRITQTIRLYVGKQYEIDDRVLFEQVDLHGPSVDAMFVDVPFACSPDTAIAEVIERIATEHPGDPEALAGAGDKVVAAAAQALLHSEWRGNGILVGGPGQGKSTLLQYVCQFHRSRMLNKSSYTDDDQHLPQVTRTARVAIRLDLRRYVEWATTKNPGAEKGSHAAHAASAAWRSIEQYIVAEVTTGSGGHQFSLEDLAALMSTEPMLIALDGLDEVANIDQRLHVSDEIVEMHARLKVDARDLVVIVATRPGATTSRLWSSHDFPRFTLQRLSQGLRIQYLRKWSAVAGLSEEATDKLQATFMDNQHVPHIRELASYPMQLAILLHLLHRRQLLPQQRTELYAEYLKTFLDREQTAEKEPLLADQRDTIVSVHAYLGWYLQTRAEEGWGAGSISRAELRRVLREHLEGQEYGQQFADRLFSAISTRVLCLVERETDRFQFEVQSLREYFTALYIFQNAPPKGIGNSRDDCLDALLQRPYWSNVCRFFVGMFSKVEVRGIRQNLRQLSTAATDLALHPLLRSMAAQFLDDRTYVGQADEPIQEVVDFALEGPGVILARDGLLDVSGPHLQFSERAGKSQATRHLKARLPEEASLETRSAIAELLRRHCATDDLHKWWWAQAIPTLAWLRTAGELGVLSDLSEAENDTLAATLTGLSTDTVWLAALVDQGGYIGRHGEIIALCKTDVNDGAADAIAPIQMTSVIPLVECATKAQLRPNAHSAYQRARRTRIRQRGRSGDVLLREITELSNYLSEKPVAEATANDWFNRLKRIAQTWGDGWVLRQAIASVPADLDLQTLADRAGADEQTLATVALWEYGARSHTKDADWWHQSLSSCKSDLDRRHWVFSLLSIARPRAVLDVAPRLNEAVSALSPKHYAAIRNSLGWFMKSMVARELVFAEPLRLRQVEASPRALWLIRAVGTEATIEWADRRLETGFESLLQPGLGDMRPLLRAVGSRTTVKAKQLKHSRSVLPLGGWASDIKLGAPSLELAREILRNPDQWPGDLAQRAAEKIGTRLASKASTLAATAKSDAWFT